MDTRNLESGQDIGFYIKTVFAGPLSSLGSAYTPREQGTPIKPIEGY